MFRSFGYGDLTIGLPGYDHPIIVPLSAAQEKECETYISLMSTALTNPNPAALIQSQWLKYRTGFVDGEETMGTSWQECIRNTEILIKCDAIVFLQRKCYCDLLVNSVENLSAHLSSVNEKNTACTSLPHIFCTSVLDATPNPSPSQSCTDGIDSTKISSGFIPKPVHDACLVRSCPADTRIPNIEPTDEPTTPTTTTATTTATTTTTTTTTTTATTTTTTTTTATRRASGSNRLVVTVALIGGLASMTLV